MNNRSRKESFYKSHKLNIDLYNSADEWIDFKEGAAIFGRVLDFFCKLAFYDILERQLCKKLFLS